MDTMYRVIKPHHPEPQDPVIFTRGEQFSFERRPTTWEGWLWCTTEDGQSAWVPEGWVRIEGDTCTLLRDYDPAELTVHPGDTLSGETTASSWLLAVTPDGQRGWVPLDCLQPA